MIITRFSSIALISMTLLVACTKPEEPNASRSAQAEAAPAQPAPASADVDSSKIQPVLVYNAYTSNALNENNEAGEPVRVFKSGEKVYTGVVLHGEAVSATVKVDWFAGGEKALGSEEVSVPVKTAVVATAELSRSSPLAPGTYKALVYLDGAPSWELSFEVTP